MARSWTDARRVVPYDVAAEEPTIARIDVLARLQLRARRLGLDLRLTNASGALQNVISLVGLEEALPTQSVSTQSGERLVQSRLLRRCAITMTGMTPAADEVVEWSAHGE